MPIFQRVKKAISFAPRPLLAIAIAGFGLAFVQPSQVQAATPCDAPIQSVIACENSKAGTPKNQWEVPGTGSSNIVGFTEDISYAPGEQVVFKVKTNATAYRYDIYRMGYYGGAGARKIGTTFRPGGQVPPVVLPQIQPECLTEPTTGLVDCGNWAVSAKWDIPTDAVSGIYFAKIFREDGTAGANHIVFVVRDDTRGSDLLFQTSDSTWQAYNKFGGNSLYSGTATGTPDGRATKVSYNRPFTTRSTSAQDWVFNAEYPMVRWLEANGYDVSYTTDVDTDRRGSELLEHDVFMSVGHDEYWSGQQRANVENARNNGVNLAFFSGNAVYWKTRWEASSASGAPVSHRTLVSYKESKANAKIDPNPAWTGTWRDNRFSPPSDGGRPENALMGTLFVANGPESRSIKVPQAEGQMRLWRNTSVATLAPGEVATFPEGTLGYEWDEDADNGFRPAGLVPLSNSTYNIPSKLQDSCCTFAAGNATHRLTMYRHASGALVFGAGTIQWSWGLDSNHDRSGTPIDERIQQATVNLFADMGVQPASLQAPLTAATASSDSSAPTVSISAPADSASLPLNQAVVISGTATDAGGGKVGVVEVSTDNGATWHRASGRENWTYSWTPTTSAVVTLKARATDDSLNIGGEASRVVATGSATPPPPPPPPATTPPTTVAPQAPPPPPAKPFANLFGTSNPVGTFDVAAQAPGGLRMAGWALDPDTPSPMSLHAYVDGVFAGAFVANGDRPDIAQAFPGYGAAHGYDAVLAVGPGNHQVCLYGINEGPGANGLLSCRSVTLTTDPFGSFDLATMAPVGPGGTRVAGWALDPNTAAPIDLHIYVDGAFAGLVNANTDRPDIAQAFPGYGAAHGFDGFVSMSPGFHTVCAYGINAGTGTNSLVGCRWVMVNNDPFGNIDVVSQGSSGLRVAGWMLDPNTAASIEAHVYVDGAFVGLLDADTNRPDIAQAFPGYGSAHGYDKTFPVAAVNRSVCVYGINKSAGNNVLIGCRNT